MIRSSLAFSFSTYANALAAVIQASAPDRAFVCGITGPWGSGKTTLMETVLTTLSKDKFLAVRFNAWAHSKQESIWRALFVSIVDALKSDLTSRCASAEDRKNSGYKQAITTLEDAEKALYTAFTRETPGEIQLDVGAIAKTGAKLALRFVPWGEIGSAVTGLFKDQSNDQSGQAKASDSPSLKEEDVDKLWGILKRDIVRQQIAQIQSLEQFRNSIAAVLKSVSLNGRKLIVAIDDVDRCLPEQGLEVFEAVKLYLDLPECVFLIAMDQDVLQHALDIRYKQENSQKRITAELYAEKMLDLTFSIPSTNDAEFKKFVACLPLPDLLLRHYDMIRLALPNNPRTWQRFANRVFLNNSILDEIAKLRGIANVWQTASIEQSYVKVQLLAFHWPAILRSLGNWKTLLDFEACVREAKVESSEFRSSANSKSPQQALRDATTSSEKIPETTWPLLGDMTLLWFLAQSPQFVNTDATNPILERMLSLDLPDALGEPSNTKVA